MKRCLLFLSFALILAGIATAARSSRANDAKLVLSGTVYDTNHSVVASSEVVAQSLEGREYRTTATDDGVYKFELPPATYRIEANAPGFCFCPKANRSVQSAWFRAGAPRLRA